jgi:hypothetical protein
VSTVTSALLPKHHAGLFRRVRIYNCPAAPSQSDGVEDLFGPIPHLGIGIVQQALEIGDERLRTSSLATASSKATFPDPPICASASAAASRRRGFGCSSRRVRLGTQIRQRAGGVVRHRGPLVSEKFDEDRNGRFADLGQTTERLVTPGVLVAIPERHERDLRRFLLPEAERLSPGQWFVTPTCSCKKNEYEQSRWASHAHLTFARTSGHAAGASGTAEPTSALSRIVSQSVRTRSHS